MKLQSKDPFQVDKADSFPTPQNDCNRAINITQHSQWENTADSHHCEATTKLN